MLPDQLRQPDLIYATGRREMFLVITLRVRVIRITGGVLKTSAHMSSTAIRM